MEPSGGQDDDANILRNASMIDLVNGSLLVFVPTDVPFPSNGSCSNDDYCNPLYAVPTGLIVLLSFLYGSISVLAVVGNFLVMWIVATSRRMQNVTNCYIANLALADIVIGLFAIPFQFQAALLQRWVFPDFMCAFCPFVQALSVNVSVFTLTAIAVDRHRAILTPLSCCAQINVELVLKARRVEAGVTDGHAVQSRLKCKLRYFPKYSARPSKRVAKCIIACIWVLALSLAIPMAISWEMIISKVRDPDTMIMDEKPFCAPSDFGTNSLYIYRLALFLLQYLTPLCIITCAYARMAYKLWGSKAPGNAQDSRDANILKNKKKVIKMLVIVVTLFALCWMPLQTYYLMQTYFPDINEYKYINIMFFCFDWLAMSNSCYNPFIYGIYNEKFKREFKQRFPFCRSQKGKSLADSIDIDKNPSFQTRLSSFRSTCDSRRQSTRLSLAINTQVNAQPNYRKSVRTGMFCYKNGIDTDPEFRAVASKRNTPNAKPPDLKSDEVSLNFNNGTTDDASFRFKNGNRPRCKIVMRDLDAIFDRKSESMDSASPEDERVTELYIFPNSNIIELKDNVQERKL